MPPSPSSDERASLGPLDLACGRTLERVEVAYATYGTFTGDNAVFVCHALTGDAHATEWWEAMVGPGRPIDTARFFVVCPNLLGGCSGTTGPSSTDPATGEAYGLRFPPIAVSDLVVLHRRLLAHLGVDRVHTAIGGSLGGMQVLQWLIDAPGEVERAVIVAASARLSAQNVALSAVAREAILRDPGFHGGDYARHGTRPALGLSVARRLAHITYLSEEGMERKFARNGEPAVTPDTGEWLGPRYDVESYLDHQAAIFLARFDALSYLYLTRIMDPFDPFAARVSLDAATRALVVAFDSDWRFGPHHAHALAAGLRGGGLRHVDERVIASPWGHDSFLLDVPEYLAAVEVFVSS